MFSFFFYRAHIGSSCITEVATMYKHFELLLFWTTIIIITIIIIIIIIISETTTSGSTTCRPPKLDHCNAPLSGYLTALQKGCSTSRMPLLVSSNLQESMTMLHPFLLIFIGFQWIITCLWFFLASSYMHNMLTPNTPERERQQMEKGREQREDKGHSKRERKGQGW